jgi:hypothetical protein
MPRAWTSDTCCDDDTGSSLTGPVTRRPHCQSDYTTGMADVDHAEEVPLVSPLVRFEGSESTVAGLIRESRVLRGGRSTTPAEPCPVAGRGARTFPELSPQAGRSPGRGFSQRRWRGTLGGQTLRSLPAAERSRGKLADGGDFPVPTSRQQRGERPRFASPTTRWHPASVPEGADDLRGQRRDSESVKQGKYSNV